MMSTKKRVIYIKRKNKVSLNNKKRKKKRVKRKKINKKNVVILLFILTMGMFGVNKVSIGISAIAKNIETKKQEEIKKQEALEAEKQLNLELEEKGGLEKKYTVVIDPGHGGKDPGNIGYTTKKKKSEIKVYEKDITLEVSKKIAAILSKQNDIQIVLTRTEDKFVELSERAQIAQIQNADVLISIHMNAESGGDTAYGIETYYRSESTDKSPELAQTIQSTIGSYIKMRDRGIKENVFQVLRDTSMPAVLVECGFITNYKEEQKLLDEKYQNQLSEGIAQGILTFLDESNKK